MTVLSLLSAVCKCSTVWTPGFTAELALKKQIVATLGFWPASVEVTSCLSSNISSDMYFLLESLLLSPEPGTTSFSLLSQHACSARENSRRDEECSEYNPHPLPKWRHRMCRGEWKAQKVTNWTKSFFSTVCLRLSLSCLAKTNKCSRSSCHKWCTKPCRPSFSSSTVWWHGQWGTWV